ncbi:serine/threonine-protein kinase pctaire-3 [Xylona heveae TC161]|uniref:cyclin-dependent kinase n=1 Tax=Xylona heveae (strain CBS 132557 / TC161) TaxID=1328760 RepID=A0A165IPQ9_XYLHT|nr:serine/threonine-protein kinase pctaire-3 [Xylona heveae TC161]KZF25204.1 serine/threonine-protein kinase pctaire-3 [Xylona heveae TC161]
MSTPPTWRTNFSFTDRLSSVIELISVYRSSFPNRGVEECQQDAKALEEDAYVHAQSLEEYHAYCKKILQEVQSKASDAGSDHSITNDGLYGDETGPGKTIGDYQNATFRYDGLFSTIYKALSNAGAVVALKVCAPASMTPPHDSRREARILREVSHPSIINLLDSFTHIGGYYVLVFPYVPYDLDHLLSQRLLSLSQVKSHLRGLFRALEHIHSLGIIHRDIKPSNILLGAPDGPVFLADFGIAWSPRDTASEPISQKITDVGTTSYRAPELLFGSTNYSQTLDLWAAGCVAAEACRLDSIPLFDAGDLGSELALIKSIFENLGTPSLDTWPEATTFPDWGKMEFHVFPPKPWNSILPNVTEGARDLVSELVQYESAQRLSAHDALKHPFLANDI